MRLGLANGLPRESIGHYTGLGQRILVELNPNILVLDAIRMYSVQCTVYSVQCTLYNVQCTVYNGTLFEKAEEVSW